MSWFIPVLPYYHITHSKVHVFYLIPRVFESLCACADIYGHAQCLIKQHSPHLESNKIFSDGQGLHQIVPLFPLHCWLGHLILNLCYWESVKDKTPWLNIIFNTYVHFVTQITDWVQWYALDKIFNECNSLLKFHYLLKVLEIRKLPSTFLHTLKIL